MKASNYSIKYMFAKDNNLPTSFVATVLKETERAVYVFGHATKDPMGACMRCGRALTNPVSIVLGIGPECLAEWGMPGKDIENLTDADKALLERLTRERIVDSWIPKSIIKHCTECDEGITPPVTHKHLVTKLSPPKASDRSIELTMENGVQIIKVSFPFSQEDLAFIKGIPNRRFIMTPTKYWTVPLSLKNIELLKANHFHVDKSLEDWANKSTTAIVNVPSKIPGLKRDLFPYQQECVQFMEDHGGRVFIGDEQGCGKTIETLAWLQLHPEHRPAILIVKASLKLNWKMEIYEWIQSKHVQILYGHQTMNFINEGEEPIIHNGEKEDLALSKDIIIINYDIVANTYIPVRDVHGKKHLDEQKGTGWVDFLQKINPKVLYVDEYQKIKENCATTKGCKKLAKKIPYISLISGTIIKNRPIEAWNAFDIMKYPDTPNWHSFIFKFCDAKKMYGRWDYTGESNTQELHQLLLNTFYIRRLKKDVLPFIKAKQYSIVPMELNNTKEYYTAETDFIHYLQLKNKDAESLRKAADAEHLVKIEVLKQLAVQGALDSMIVWIREFLEDNDKLAIFATHKLIIKTIMDAFPKIAVSLTGDTSNKNKQKVVDSFQTDPKTKLFIGNIQAAGEGITLTAASSLGIIELPWSPGDLTQVEDRVHRIGQEGTVMIYYLIPPRTIYDRIGALLDVKKKVTNSVIDGIEQESKSSFKSLYSNLIESYTSNTTTNLFATEAK